MWPFRKRLSLADSGVFQGLTDPHCHLLPGVDDGARTLGDSLGILSLYGELGIREAWLTPHVMEDYPNATGSLRSRFDELLASWSGEVKLHLASENMIDGLFAERFASRDLLPLGGEGRLLLVETSCIAPPMGLRDILGRVKSAGYVPVLAHPERYVYMDAGDYGELHGAGTLLQLNLPSLAGAYGQSARDKAHRLLARGLYSLCGTDTHFAGLLREAAARPCLTMAEARSLLDLAHKAQELLG